MPPWWEVFAKLWLIHPGLGETPQTEDCCTTERVEYIMGALMSLHCETIAGEYFIANYLWQDSHADELMWCIDAAIEDYSEEVSPLYINPRTISYLIFEPQKGWGISGLGFDITNANITGDAEKWKRIRNDLYWMFESGHWEVHKLLMHQSATT